MCVCTPPILTYKLDDQNICKPGIIILAIQRTQVTGLYYDPLCTALPSNTVDKFGVAGW